MAMFEIYLFQFHYYQLMTYKSICNKENQPFR